MDIVEFVERFFDITLKDWQKEHLRMLNKLRKDANVRIVMPKHAGESQMHVYMNPKELIPNGKTTYCK